MIRSMTGYGSAEALLAGRKFVVEMKSVNHRYLEISLRLPGMLSPLETEIKRKIGELFSRGRIEASIRIDNGDVAERSDRLTLNLPLARNYYDLLAKLKSELKLEGEVSLALMTGFKDLFVPGESTHDPAELWSGLSGLLAEAMRTLAEMREREGESLCKDLTARLALIAAVLESISARAPQVIDEYRRRLQERIRELTGEAVIDEARLLQEVAIMADKSDITEEIVRFRSHMEQFQDLLTKEEGAGRKIDFLIQEMGREINTIGSKSSDSEISRSVIEIKSELSKLREQVQNVE